MLKKEEKYPWLDWFTGEDKELKKGINFFNSVYDFRNQIRQANNRYLEKYPDLVKKVSINVVDIETIILLLNRDDEDKNLPAGNCNLPAVQQKNNLSTFKTKQKRGFNVQWAKVINFLVRIANGNVEKKTIKQPKRDPITNQILLLQDLKDEKGNNVYLPGQVSNKLFQYEDVETVISLPEKEVFYFPNDIPVSPKVAASRIRNEAVAFFAEKDLLDKIDPTLWDYSWDDNKLIISVGQLGIDTLNRKRKQETENLNYTSEIVQVNQNNAIPITKEKLREWVIKLREKGELHILRGKDYSCTSERAKAILYTYAEEAGLRMYEAVLTAEKGHVMVNLKKLDLQAMDGVGYDDTFVNKAYLQILENEKKILEYRPKLELAKNTNTQKAIDDFTRRIKELEDENQQLNNTIKKQIYQPEDFIKIAQEQERKQLELEEQQEKEDKERAQNLLAPPQPRIYTIPELQQKIILAKQKNNVTALRIFREKLAALGGKEDAI